MAKRDDTVFYGLRKDGRTITLVEAKRETELGSMTRISAKAAQHWVLAGRLHETGLWVEVIQDGRRNRRVLRYAEPLD